MSNPRLHIVGTVHFDLQGRERLSSLLDRLQPDIVAVEMSADRAREGERPAVMEKDLDLLIASFCQSGMLLTKEQEAALREATKTQFESYGFELFSSREYVQKNSQRRLEYIDTSVFSKGADTFFDGLKKCQEGTLQAFTEEAGIAWRFGKILEEGAGAYLGTMQKNIDAFYENSAQIEQFVAAVRDPLMLQEFKKQVPSSVYNALSDIMNPRRDKFMSVRIRELFCIPSWVTVLAVMGLAHVPGVRYKLRDLDPTCLLLSKAYEF